MNIKTNIKTIIVLGLLSASHASIASQYVFRYNAPGISAPNLIRSCQTILENNPGSASGKYTINPTGSNPFSVHCDMKANGEGWTRVGYKKDLPLINRWTDGDKWRWLPESMDYSQGYLELTDKQINEIRSVSKTARQKYVAQCVHALIYYNPKAINSNYHTVAMGIKLHDGTIAKHGKEVYSIPVTVINDQCQLNDHAARETEFHITHKGVPVINVQTWDTGDSLEKIGAKLISNPAWFR